MSDWLQTALERIQAGAPAGLVTLLAVEGSTPREAGAKMLVWDAGQWGTIGGGALEHQAADQARRMLERGEQAHFAIQDYPLGPLLAQCCGGRVRLLIERLDEGDADWLGQASRLRQCEQSFEIRRRIVGDALARSVVPLEADADPGAPITVNGLPVQARAARPADGDEIREHAPPIRPRLLLFGAGHVGQALARVLEPLPFRLDWRDSRAESMTIPGVKVASSPALIEAAGQGAPYVLILTHDHALDYALASAALAAGGAGYLGMIGSRTKRARFLGRLRADGLSETALAHLVCPIGLPQLKSKAPEVIAVSVAADLLMRLEASRLEPVRELALAGL